MFSKIIVHIYVIYIPSNTDIQAYERFLDLLIGSISNTNKHIVIAGYFNIPQYSS